MFWIYVFFAVCITLCAYRVYRYWIPHIKYKSLHQISPFATIVDIRHNNESWGREKYIQTIVEFSDGFEYSTYKTGGVPCYTHTIIYVDSLVMESIIKKAVKAHSKLVQKKIKLVNE